MNNNDSDTAIKGLSNDSNDPLSQDGQSDGPVWRDHIIVCELQTLGFSVAEQLKGVGLQVVAIEANPNHNLAGQAERLQISLIEGEARDPAILLQSGLKQAAALIICGKNDLYNLQIILEARRLCENIRIVANLADPQLGWELNRAVKNLSVLSLPRMAGPTFTDACLSSSILDFFTMDGHEMAVVKARITRPTTLEQISSRALPLFVWETPDSPAFAAPTEAEPDDKPAWLEVAPQEQQNIQPGQYITMAGRIEDLLQLPSVELNEKKILETLTSNKRRSGSHPGNPKPPGPRLRAQVKAVLRQLAGAFYGPFRYALIAVVLITIISTLLLWRFYQNPLTGPQGQPLGFSLLDALYFTITVVTSVGFGDHNFAQQDWTLKLFGIFLILVGVAATSVLYAFAANFIITRRLAQTLGREQATELEDHVIVCGLGALGYEVVQGLHRQGLPVVGVDKSEQGAFNLDIQRLGVPVIYGDISQPQILRAANVGKASTLALLTGDDLANLKAALSARAEFASLPANQHPLHVVLRLFDLDLAERVAETFNIQTSYSASGLAAPYFVGAALDYEVVSTFYLRRQPFIVARLEISPVSRLAGQTLQQFYRTTRMHVIACALSQPPRPTGSYGSHLRLYPGPATILSRGNIIYLIGSPYEMLKVYRLNQKAEI
jgi:Trk K+ transport system NAD-binding subunit